LSNSGVGIGTTAPANMLDVNGSVAVGSYAGSASGGSNELIVSGKVGIGTTSPSDLLDVAGAIGLTTTTATLPRNGIYSPLGNQLAFVTNSTSALTVTSTGSVGIGTTGPAVLLQVGSASASGTVAQLANSSGTCTHTPGASTETVSCSSDIRLKKDIVDSDSALKWLLDRRIRDYTLRATGERRTGVIAQEVSVTHPDMVHWDGFSGIYMVDEPNPWKLIKAFQELQTEEDNGTAAIAALTKEIEAYERAPP
jgi:Chaperone of endosialidase